MKMRIDQALVEKGLVPSKTKAQEMIELGQVHFKIASHKPFVKCTKASQQVDADSVEIQISSENLLKYVSRAGFKLESALKHLNLDVKNFHVLDVGQSTGGFTDCLLQHGAKHVVGIDVATDELAPQLKNDPRVASLTGINAKNLDQSLVKEPALELNRFDLVVVDVSFISVHKVMPGLLKFLRKGGHLLALIKPQFEVGSVNMPVTGAEKIIDKKGVVTSKAALAKIQDDVTKLACELGLLQIQYFASELKGRDGNQEYFLYGTKQ
jgi:23S rRNA (cytidine1920-2'-O)/16S rRNA (cytidine1409-2'-O)-methyltransferase